MYAWIDWEDETTSVHNLSFIKNPRKEFSQYRDGEDVMGIFKNYQGAGGRGECWGVIVEISADKKDLEKQLAARQTEQILDAADLDSQLVESANDILEKPIAQGTKKGKRKVQNDESIKGLANTKKMQKLAKASAENDVAKKIFSDHPPADRTCRLAPTSPNLPTTSSNQHVHVPPVDITASSIPSHILPSNLSSDIPLSSLPPPSASTSRLAPTSPNVHVSPVDIPASSIPSPILPSNLSSRTPLQNLSSDIPLSSLPAPSASTSRLAPTSPNVHVPPVDIPAPSIPSHILPSNLSSRTPLQNLSSDIPLSSVPAFNIPSSFSAPSDHMSSYLQPFSYTQPCTTLPSSSTFSSTSILSSDNTFSNVHTCILPSTTCSLSLPFAPPVAMSSTPRLSSLRPATSPPLNLLSASRHSNLPSSFHHSSAPLYTSFPPPPLIRPTPMTHIQSTPHHNEIQSLQHTYVDQYNAPAGQDRRQLSMTNSWHIPESNTSAECSTLFSDLPCGECLLLEEKLKNASKIIDKRDAEITSLKMRLDHLEDQMQLQTVENQTSCEASVTVSSRDGYSPCRGLKIPKTTHIIVNAGDEMQLGYQLLVEGHNVAVSSNWLTTVLARLKRKEPSEVLKRLMDGLMNPWDYGVRGGTKAFEETKWGAVIRAIEGFGVQKLRMLPIKSSNTGHK